MNFEININMIPQVLKEYDQWVLWKLESKGEGKFKKVPYSTDGKPASVSNSTTWSSFEDTQNAYEKNRDKFSGIGFVLTESDPFVFLDWDHIFNPSTGEWDQEALDEILSLNTYAEISPSEEGVHAIIIGEKDPNGMKHTKVKPEIYSDKRFMTVTGNKLPDVSTTINENNSALKSIQDKVGYYTDTDVSKAPVATKEQIDKPINSEDQLILNRCRRAKNNENFMNLWTGTNLSRYKTPSEAEMALADIFAYHTRDIDQIKRLVGMSALNRVKWDRDDYTTRTIEKALEYTNDDNSWNGIPIPADYEVDNDGIFERSWDSKKKDYSYTLICYTPVAISGIGEDIDRNEFWYQITFVTSLGETRHEYVKQEDLTKRANFMNFANKITIIEKQTNDMCEYFAKSIKQCATKLPKQIFVRNNGWKKNPEGFVVGNRFYTDSSIQEVVQVNDDDINGLSKRGTLEEWVEGVDGVIGEPITRFKCYCMGAAVLLRPLGAQSFLVDHSGDTSKGKTFGFKVAVSLYGNPKELELSARSTSTYLEHQATNYNDLPLFVDETSLQTDDNLKDLIYMVANEVGKGRGTKDGGIHKLHRWKSVAFVTGEKPLVDSDGFGGQQVRVISIQSHMPTMKSEIERAEQTIKSNYGHIIDLFMEKVFKHADVLEDKYRGYRDRFANNGSTTMDRMGNTFAVIALAGEILEEVFEDIGIEVMNNEELTQKLFQETVRDKPIEPYALRALRTFNGWIEANRNYFVTVGDSGPQPFKIYGYLEDGYINVNSTVAKDAINSFRIKPSSVKKDWSQWGVLIPYSDGRDYKLAIGDKGSRVSVYRISVTKMQEVLEQGVV